MQFKSAKSTLRDFMLELWSNIPFCFQFAGAAQSLGAGAILVDPWNITEVAASIKYALDMPADERGKRHQHNFKNVTTHISQEWAATFVRCSFFFLCKLLILDIV